MRTGKARPVEHRACRKCGEWFLPDESNAAVTPRRFCSRECERSRRPCRPVQADKPCGHCGLPFDFEQSDAPLSPEAFCSSICEYGFGVRLVADLEEKGTLTERDGALKAQVDNLKRFLEIHKTLLTVH